MVLQFLVLIGGAYLLGEIYKKYVSPKQKRKLENFTKVHHGEAGIVMTGAGIITKSPNLTDSGIGLILHDRKDYKKWFTGDKKR